MSGSDYELGLIQVKTGLDKTLAQLEHKYRDKELPETYYILQGALGYLRDYHDDFEEAQLKIYEECDRVEKINSQLKLENTILKKRIKHIEQIANNLKKGL